MIRAILSAGMLDYEGRIVGYEETRQDVVWRVRRIGYYFGQALLFFVIVYRVGPNLFLFGSPFSPRPGDFAAIAQTRYAPVVAAIKAYQRDRGELPSTTHQLIPRLLPKNAPFGRLDGTARVIFQLSETSGVLAYDFTPATEGWVVFSPRYQGPIPAPLVPAAASPQPVASRPAGTPAVPDTE